MAKAVVLTAPFSLYRPTRTPAARIPAKQPPQDMCAALLTRAVARLADQNHPACGLLPSACIRSDDHECLTRLQQRPEGAGIFLHGLQAEEQRTPVKNADATSQLAGARHDPQPRAEIRKRGRHGDLFADSDSDDPVAETVSAHNIQETFSLKEASRVTADAATANHRHQAKCCATETAVRAPAQQKAGSFRARVERQQADWQSIVNDLNMQRAEVGRADANLAWLCSALGTAAAA